MMRSKESAYHIQCIVTLLNLFYCAKSHYNLKSNFDTVPFPPAGYGFSLSSPLWVLLEKSGKQL